MASEEQRTQFLFFPHDLNANANPKLMRLQMKLGIEGYGIYWRLVEYMHQFDIAVGKEDTIAYLIRVDSDKLVSVLNDFELFEIKDGFYFSDRIQRNMEYVENIKDKRSESAKKRWLIATFKAEFAKVFKEQPILSEDDINSLMKWSKEIPDLKEKFPQIFEDLKAIKFKDFPNFKPSANWLLAKNHLAKILNGEFVNPEKEQAKKEKEQAKKRAKVAAEKQEINEETEKIREEIYRINTKEQAIEFLKEHGKNLNLTSRFIPPYCTELIEKFKITSKELKNVQS